MRVTIYDIAKKAKVGIGTVSRVFNDHPSVSETTRKRVTQVARRLNYHPHPYARGLARNRTNSILAVIPFFTTFFFVEVLRGVQASLGERDYDLVLYGVNDPEQVSASVKRSTLRGRADGLLFFSMRTPKEFLGPNAQRTPMVLVDAHHKNFDSIYVDNVAGAAAATQHLIKLGHQKIGMLSANLESPPARQRLDGFLKAMHENDLEVKPEFVRASTSTTLDGFTKETGAELMKEFLAMGSAAPTALFVSSDVQAAGALQALAQAGMNCPNDIALVGFDDIELASYLQLTTMRQPMYKMGALAVEMLFNRIKDPNAPARVERFMPELVVRTSCGAARSAQSDWKQSRTLA